MDAKIMGQFIAEIRKEKGMTQADLAQALHVTSQAISKWERGIGFPDYQFYGKISYYVFVTNKSSSELTVKAKSLLHTYASYTVPANTTISFDIRNMESDTKFYLTFDGSFMSFSGNIT